MGKSTRSRGRRSFIAVLVGLGLVAAAGGAEAAPAPPAGPASASEAAAATAAPGAPGPLDILLTNDDGFDAPGIEAVRDALVAAGHDVTIVAPATDQSGSSGKLNLAFGTTIRVVEEADEVYSVAGSPADAVLVGLRVVLADDPPDLVISGSNRGQNAGGLVGHSGTVGAAVTALENGVPAVAVSTEVDLSAGPDATLERFPATADFVVELVATLQATRSSGPLLPGGHGLNVNYPIVTSGDGQPRGVAFTQVGDWSFVDVAYRPAGAGSYVVMPVFPSFDEPVRHADTSALARDQISISVLDGDLGTSLVGGARTFARLLPLL